MTTTSHPLSAESRTVIGKKVKDIRKEGILPAVVYGHQQETTSISLNKRDFVKLYNEIGSSTLIDLTIDGEKSHKALVHQIQRHPSSGNAIHVDFYQVNMKEKLQTNISLEFTGESAAVEVEGGSFLAIRDSVEVECLPDALIPHIEVDISPLITFEDSIRVSDIILPEGMTLITDPEETVAQVNPPRSEEELEELEETPEETDVSSIESENDSGTVPAEGAEDKEAKTEE